MSITKQAVPLPARKNILASGPRGSKYELNTLVAGSQEAIVLEGDGTAEDAEKNKSKLSSAVSNFRKTYRDDPAVKNASFTIRRFEVQEDGETLHRVGVWRLADKAPKVAAAPAVQAEATADSGADSGAEAAADSGADSASE